MTLTAVFSAAIAGQALAWGHSSGTRTFFVQEQRRAERMKAAETAQPAQPTIQRKHKQPPM